MSHCLGQLVTYITTDLLKQFTSKTKNRTVCNPGHGNKRAFVWRGAGLMILYSKQTTTLSLLVTYHSTGDKEQMFYYHIAPVTIICCYLSLHSFTFIDKFYFVYLLWQLQFNSSRENKRVTISDCSLLVFIESH